MASIDKIYGTTKQYDELKSWLKENKPGYLRYLYQREMDNDQDRPISNFSTKADMWLLENCPIKFVTDRIKEQYELEDD